MAESEDRRDSLSLDRKCVVITKESMFYVPEDDSTLPLEYYSSSPHKEDTNSPGRQDEPSMTARNVPLYPLGLCVLLLALLALLLFYNRGSLATNLLCTAIGLMLGYSTAITRSWIKVKGH